jgi:hypothetical protein
VDGEPGDGRQFFLCEPCGFAKRPQLRTE